MRNPVNNLHDQNLKLRNEIKRLKNSIRDLSSSNRERPGSKTSESDLTEMQKENILQDLKKEISKAPEAVGVGKWKKLPPSGKLCSSSNSSQPASVRVNKAAQENLKKIEKLSGFSGINNATSKEKEEFIGDKHSKLIDSFQSYYESEEENLSKFGKCELSYVEYKKDHEKGSRRREKQMAEEIESLRKENSDLKGKLQKVAGSKLRNAGKVANIQGVKSIVNIKSIRNSARAEGIMKSAYSVTPRPRSSSRLSGRSFLTCNSFLSARRKHCRKCAALLAKGFSTIHCTKHNPLKPLKK